MVYYNYRWQLIKFELPFLDLAIAQSRTSHSGIVFHHIINYRETKPLLRSFKILEKTGSNLAFSRTPWHRSFHRIRNK